MKMIEILTNMLRNMAAKNSCQTCILVWSELTLAAGGTSLGLRLHLMSVG